jgi:aminopeptidase-like protein
MTEGALAEELLGLMRELYPICRSISGDGVRQTLDVLGRYVPLQRREVPSGTPVLDWVVPNEWNIRDAWIKDGQGRRVVDFQASNLHVVSYSAPVRGRFTLSELRPRLHTLPAQPDAIPYRTSYYEEAWGFCLTQRQLEALPEGEYDVCIDSTLAPGSLTYAELLIPGTTSEEILISSHVCHPSLADDNLSGVCVATLLARELHRARGPAGRYGVRFVLAPGTIGAITWLEQNRATASRIAHGLTLTCLGDAEPFTFKKTFDGASRLDRVVARVLHDLGYPHQLIDFFPYGYDERQFNSPGFRLPVGSLMRGRHGQFAEYHTSLDDLSFVQGPRLAESYAVLSAIVSALQHDLRYTNLQPFGEPQLGKRGLYRAVGGTGLPGLQFAMLWVLNMSDGKHALLDVAERSGLSFSNIKVAADLLVEHGLLAPVDADPENDSLERRK